MLTKADYSDADFEEILTAANDVLVLEFWNVEPQLETSIEIALQLGSKAIYVHGGALLPYSQGYRHRKNSVAPEERIVNMLIESGCSGSYNCMKRVSSHIDGLPHLPFRLPLGESSFNSNEDFLKTFGVDCSAGRSILASLMDIENDQLVDIREHRALAELFLQSYLIAFRLTTSLLADRPSISHIVLFNGRFPETAGATDAARVLGCNVLFHERSYANENEFSLTPYPVHDFSRIKDDIVRICSRGHKRDLDKSVELFRGIAAGDSLLGVQFYGRHNLVRRILTHIPVFRYDRSSTVVNRKTILFATCSDDEFFFADSGMLSNPYSEWGDQKQAIIKICSLCRGMGYSFILRIHPHTSTKSLRVASDWVEVSKAVLDAGGYVYGPQDPTSIYSLIRRSDIFVTSASQSGIEACALGKPTVNIRESRYNDIGCGAVKIDSLDELTALLQNIPLLESIVDNSKPEMYSYWMTHQSYPFKHIYFKDQSSYLKGNLIRPERVRYSCARKLNRSLRHFASRLVCYAKGSGFIAMFFWHSLSIRK